MKKKDEVAFLRSITGTTPIKKKNTLKKISISVNKLKKTEINTTKIFIENLTKPKPNTKEKNLSVIKKIEKTSVNRKLKRGKILPDKKIDFHGMFLLDAEELFNETVVNCYNNNQRCILFITGKGIYKKERPRKVRHTAQLEDIEKKAVFCNSGFVLTKGDNLV